LPKEYTLPPLMGVFPDVSEVLVGQGEIGVALDDM
jgi:hypothetical protein